MVHDLQQTETYAQHHNRPPKQVLRHARLRLYNDGDALNRIGTKTEHVFVVLRGRVQLRAADGRMFSAGAGAVLCAWPVLLNAAQHLQATAGSVVLTYTLPATKLMVLTPPDFDVALLFFDPRMYSPIAHRQWMPHAPLCTRTVWLCCCYPCEYTTCTTSSVTSASRNWERGPRMSQANCKL